MATVVLIGAITSSSLLFLLMKRKLSLKVHKATKSIGVLRLLSYNLSFRDDNLLVQYISCIPTISSNICCIYTVYCTVYVAVLSVYVCAVHHRQTLSSLILLKGLLKNQKQIFKNADK